MNDLQLSHRRLAARWCGVIVVVAMQTACTASMQELQPPATAPASAAITVMTFNVQNLFDTRHDAGKNDFEYLPRSEKQTAEHRAKCAPITVDRWRDQCLNRDWNEAVLDKKLRVVAAAILAAGDGRGPDIIALQEVENLAVLERLRQNYLAPAGYQPAVLLEGADLRGIDVAFLSRFPLAQPPKLHPIPFRNVESTRVDDTRGILQADFQMPDGTVLTGYSVHFPAPYHPAEMRVQAYRFLNRLRAALPPNRPAFAAGDFNTTEEEVQTTGVLEKMVMPHWVVAHQNGCAGCKGTYYYPPKDSWSFLDMILWSRSPNSAWRLRPGSARLGNEYAAQVAADGTPAHFDLPAATGVSDHWPLLVTLDPANR